MIHNIVLYANSFENSAFSLHRLQKLTPYLALISKYIQIIGSLLFVGMVIIIIIGLFRHRYKLSRQFNPAKIVAIIPAHNEENSIGLVIDSCKNSNFDRVYVIADSCTDNTVEIAKNKGVHVLTVNKKSKALSLAAMIPFIVEEEGKESFYMFFDAGNIFESTLLKNLLPYIQSFPILQVRVRNANSSSWVARMFIIMSAYYFKFQNALMNLHLSSIIAGSGWGAYGWVFQKYPFECVSVVDDFEYSLKMGLPIAYVSSVNIYDEKTDDFVVSFKQRLRWNRGYFYELLMETRAFKSKPYFLFIPLSLLFWIISLFGLMKNVNPVFLILSVLVNAVLYLSTLDMEDLKYLRPYDLITFYFFNLTNIFVIFISLITFKNLNWYRTPHKGVSLRKTDT